MLAVFACTAAAQDVGTLARAYADNPSLANRSALLKYAASRNDANAGLALLAAGAVDAQSERKGEALRNLAAAGERVPKLADYIAYLSATVSLDGHDFGAAARFAESVVRQESKSPLAGQAALLAAKAYSGANQPAQALEVLRRAYEDLPQPDGDSALAGAYDALHDVGNAVAYDQRVWLAYPLSQQATGAEAELNRYRELLGPAYHAPSTAARLARATKLLEARDFARARRELEEVASTATGVERELSLLRIGMADQGARKDQAALSYFQSLRVSTPEVDAERLYRVLASGRRMNRLDVVSQALAELERNYPTSEWRLQGLVAAGNEYLLLNQPHDFEPLFWTCQQQFPKSAQAPYCHWRVAFSAYLENRKDSEQLLRSHVERFPGSDRASAALYFLGRLAERNSNWAEARAWYDQILRTFPNYYYAMLARERRSQAGVAGATPSRAVIEFLSGIHFPARPLTGSFEPLPAIMARFERARMLHEAALDQYAELELRFGAKGGLQPEAFGLELARFASSRSAPDRAVRYLKHYAPGYLVSPLESAPREFWTLAFPLAWRGPLEQYSREAGLDPFMVAALVRQESEFDPKAISRANAYGLTQLLPSTGKELSRRLFVRGFSTKSLLEPEMNLRLGTQYLRSLLAQFNGQWEPALASYNAGKTRVSAWLTRVQYREPAEFVESIPFSETRNYVQIVMRNADLYRRLYTN